MRFVYIILLFQLALRSNSEDCQESLQSLLEECKMFEEKLDHSKIEETCKNFESCIGRLNTLQEKCYSEVQRRGLNLQAMTMKAICDSENILKDPPTCQQHLSSCVEKSNPSLPCQELKSCILENLEEKCPEVKDEIKIALRNCSDTDKSKRSFGHLKTQESKRDKRDMIKPENKSKRDRAEETEELPPSPLSLKSKSELKEPIKNDDAVSEVSLRPTKAYDPLEDELSRIKRRVKKRRGKGRKKGSKAWKKKKGHMRKLKARKLNRKKGKKW